jgi:hypothetical protein
MEISVFEMERSASVKGSSWQAVTKRALNTKQEIKHKPRNPGLCFKFHVVISTI